MTVSLTASLGAAFCPGEAGWALTAANSVKSYTPSWYVHHRSPGLAAGESSVILLFC